MELTGSFSSPMPAIALPVIALLVPPMNFFRIEREWGILADK